MLKMFLMNNWHLKQAIYHLTEGDVIAYPTEAVYGLGCDPFNEKAITRLLLLKQRSWKKGLILIAAHYDQLCPFLKPLSSQLEQKILSTWPGAVTWLLPAQTHISPYLRGTSNQIAVRVTAHPHAKALCQSWKGALVSTSANMSGRLAAKTAFDVRRTFSKHIKYIMPGQVGDRSRPSEIRDALTNRVLRH